MAEVRFIHTADLHLDTPFKGLSSWNADLSKKLRDATFRSFRRITDLCIEKKVDFLIISGDVFDSENKSLSGQLRFFPELKRLSDNNIPTYLVCGNHDPYTSWINVSGLPDNVYCFNPDECKYESFRRGGERIADIYGISFRESSVKQNLAKKFSLTSSPAPVSIAVLHGVVGEPGPHMEYAPFRVEDVLDKGFDYWALGHIHKTRIVRAEKPVMAYPGNPQGRDFGETGKKGCYLITIREDRTPEMEFLPVQLIRFEVLNIDLTGAENVVDLESRIINGYKSVDGYDDRTNLILRIELTGRTILHEQLNRPGETEKILEHLNEGQLSLDTFVWIDRIELNTRPDIDLESLKKGSDFPSEVLKEFDRVLSDEKEIDMLFAYLEGECANAQVKRYAGNITGESRYSLIEKARTILLDHLTGGK